MWKEYSTDNVVHPFHSLKQKTRILIFIDIYFFYFIFEFCQLLLSRTYEAQNLRVTPIHAASPVET